LYLLATLICHERPTSWIHFDTFLLINLALSGGQSVEANYEAGQPNQGEYGTDASNNLVTGLLQPGGVLFSLKSASGTLDLLHFVDLEIRAKRRSEKVRQMICFGFP
jgi:hypothetical protein